MAKSQIGLVGLAVMGENLALNIERNGFPITIYNRSTDKTEALLAGRAKGLKFTGAKTVQELVASLERPRRIILMVKAGAPAFSIRMMRRGRSSEATSSCTVFAPVNFRPLARPASSASVLSVDRL